MSQLLNPPAPPESRKTMKPRIELIGTTGYAIRIQEDKSGQLIELHAANSSNSTRTARKSSRTSPKAPSTTSPTRSTTT